MGEVTFDILAVDKASDAFQKVGRSVDDTGDKLDKLSKIKDPPAPVNLTKGMKEAEAASERLSKALRFEADQLGKVRVAEAKLGELREFLAPGDSQLVAAEERLAAATRGVAAAQKEAAKASSDLNSARAKAAEPAQQKVDIDLSKGLATLKTGLVGELKSAGILGGAALAGGIAAGLSTVGAAGLFIGIAAAAQSSNAQVAEAYATLWSQVKAGAQAAGSELSGEFIKSAESLGRTFNALKPQLVEGMIAAKPAIHDVIDGVDRMARSAMPGLVTAAKASSEATGGLADMMESAGRGVNNFFTESSRGAAAGGESMAAFGRIVERLGSFAGRILAELASNSSSVFPALEGAVGSAAGAIENLAHTALPALASGAALSLTGLGLLLNLANTIVTALGPMAGLISNVATSLKLVDLISFGAVGKSWETFKTSLGAAEGFAGKAKAGLSGVVGTLGPVGILAGVGALALDSLSKAQQEAAQEAADHRERIRSLSDALRESNGVITDNIRAMSVKKLADTQVADTGKSVLEVAHLAGVNVGELTDAYLGNASAQKSVNEQMQNYVSSSVDAVAAQSEWGPAMDANAEAITKLQEMFPGLSGEFGQAKSRQELLNEAMHNGAGAADAQRKALQDLQAQLDGMVDKDLAYRNAVDATSDAEKASAAAKKEAADALQKHGAQSDEYKAKNEAYADSVRGVEAAEIAQARAARDLAVINSAANSEAGKGADGQRAYAREILNMAAAAGNTAPPALRQMVSGLSDTDLQAQGASRSIDGAGNAVYRLPNGKTVTVTADDDATWRTQRIAQQLASLPVLKVITVEERHIITQNLGNVPSGWQSAGRKAGGGWVSGPGTTTSDSIPALLSDGEYVVNAAAAARNRGLLEALNSGTRPIGLAVGGAVGRGGGHTPVVKNYYYSLQVYDAGNGKIDLQAQFDRMAMLSGSMS